MHFIQTELTDNKVTISWTFYRSEGTLHWITWKRNEYYIILKEFDLVLPIGNTPTSLVASELRRKSRQLIRAKSGARNGSKFGFFSVMI